VFADRDKNDARIDNEAKDNKKNTTQQEQQKSTERQKVSKCSEILHGNISAFFISFFI
jgi:hypothetical protein